MATPSRDKRVDFIPSDPVTVYFTCDALKGHKRSFVNLIQSLTNVFKQNFELCNYIMLPFDMGKYAKQSTDSRFLLKKSCLYCIKLFEY